MYIYIYRGKGVVGAVQQGSGSTHRSRTHGAAHSLVRSPATELLAARSCSEHDVTKSDDVTRWQQDKLNHCVWKWERDGEEEREGTCRAWLGVRPITSMLTISLPASCLYAIVAYMPGGHSPTTVLGHNLHIEFRVAHIGTLVCEEEIVQKKPK